MIPYIIEEGVIGFVAVEERSAKGLMDAEICTVMAEILGLEDFIQMLSDLHDFLKIM